VAIGALDLRFGQRAAAEFGEVIDLERHAIKDGLFDVGNRCSDKDAAKGMDPLPSGVRPLNWGPR